MTTETDAGTDPLDRWRGEFGKAYMSRNDATSDATAEASVAFGRIIDATGLRTSLTSILEVGANVGINLRGLRTALGEEVELSAVEPNPAACARLRSDAGLGLAQVIEADAYHIPVPDDSFDLVFTNGVLIHIPPARLPDAMREICRVARKYVLCSEYFSHTPQEVVYHGHAGMLWKRDFGSAYLEVRPELRVLGYGFLWQHEFAHFDNLNWWLFEKPSGQTAG